MEGTLLKPYCYVPPQRVGFVFAPFCSENSYRLYILPILVRNQVWFLRELRNCINVVVVKPLQNIYLAISKLDPYNYMDTRLRR